VNNLRTRVNSFPSSPDRRFTRRLARNFGTLDAQNHCQKHGGSLASKAGQNAQFPRVFAFGTATQAGKHWRSSAYFFPTTTFTPEFTRDMRFKRDEETGSE
jgi:hypothetical protein